jgi:UPF0755 protein
VAELFFDRDEDTSDHPQVIADRDRPRRRFRRRPPDRRRRWPILVALLLVLGIMAGGLGAVWLQRQIDPPGDPGRQVSIDVPQGATTADVAELLAAQDVVSDARIFRYYLRVRGGGPFQAGSYRLRQNSSMGDARAALEEGPRLAFTDVTVPEGRWVSDVAEIVAEVPGFDAAVFTAEVESGVVRSLYQPQDPRPGTMQPLEGLLFPDTFRVDENEDEQAVLARMVSTLDQVATELGYAEAAARVGREPYEVLIVASLIEAEAKVDGDRGKISRVIYNRLEQDIRLGIDATVYYALQRRGGSLTRSDLQVDSPYNTRENFGLPPSPIGLPGRASLEAALNPEPGPWIYYVLADEQGHHAFSETDEQFQQDVAAARRNGLIP